MLFGDLKSSTEVVCQLLEETIQTVANDGQHTLKINYPQKLDIHSVPQDFIRATPVSFSPMRPVQKVVIPPVWLPVVTQQSQVYIVSETFQKLHLIQS